MYKYVSQYQAGSCHFFEDLDLEYKGVKCLQCFIFMLFGLQPVTKRSLF